MSTIKIYDVEAHCNRDVRRKVEKFRRHHPEMSFTDAYNALFHTNFIDPSTIKTTVKLYDQPEVEAATEATVIEAEEE